MINNLSLADGSMIDVRSGKRVTNTEINKAFSDRPDTSMLPAKGALPIGKTTRRYIDDLPSSPAQSKAISAVAGLALFGLADTDIAYVLSTDIDVVVAIKDTEGYKKFLEAMLQNIREHDTDKIRKKINEAAEGASDTIIQLIKSPDQKIKLAASQDILNRAKNGEYNSEGGRGNTSSLTIRIVTDADNPSEKVRIDIDG